MGVAAVVLASALLAGAVWEHVATRMEHDRIEGALQDARAARSAQRPAGIATPAVTIPEAQVRAINTAIGKLNLPWPEIFRVVEAATPKEVALLALEPDGRRRSLVVQAEALAPSSMLDFVERLRADALLEDAFLIRHEQREQDPQRPYRFAIEIRWRAVGP